jgi:hypothetical protein
MTESQISEFLFSGPQGRLSQMTIPVHLRSPAPARALIACVCMLFRLADFYVLSIPFRIRKGRSAS